MGERREIARGSHRAASRHNRQHALLEECEQQLHRLDARSRVALGEGVRAQKHRRADDLVGIRVADSARMRPQQAQLELRGLLLGNRDSDEAAEAGVDAVGVLAASVRGSLDELAGGNHALPRLVGQLGPRTIDRDGPHVVDGQVFAREADRRPLRHQASLGRSPPRTLPHVPPGGLATPAETVTAEPPRICRDFVEASRSAIRRRAAARGRATDRGRGGRWPSRRQPSRRRLEAAPPAPNR